MGNNASKLKTEFEPIIRKAYLCIFNTLKFITKKYTKKLRYHVLSFFLVLFAFLGNLFFSVISIFQYFHSFIFLLLVIFYCKQKFQQFSSHGKSN